MKQYVCPHCKLVSNDKQVYHDPIGVLCPRCKKIVKEMQETQEVEDGKTKDG